MNSWHEYASKWADEVLCMPFNKVVILDTETTGTDVYDEVVEVSAINSGGLVLLNNVLVQPTCIITSGAMNIHHITHTMLYGVPGFLSLYSRLEEIIKGKLLLTYNLEFDMRMLHQSAKAVGVSLDLGFSHAQCVMEMAALWQGDYDEKHGNFHWPKLEGGDHSALGDCFATLKLMQRMADD